MKKSNITVYRGADMNPLHVTLVGSVGTEYDLANATSYDCDAEDGAGAALFSMSVSVEGTEGLVLNATEADIDSIPTTVTQGRWDLLVTYSSGKQFRVTGGKLFVKNTTSNY